MLQEVMFNALRGIKVDYAKDGDGLEFVLLTMEGPLVDEDFGTVFSYDIRAKVIMTQVQFDQIVTMLWTQKPDGQNEAGHFRGPGGRELPPPPTPRRQKESNEGDE